MWLEKKKKNIKRFSKNSFIENDSLNKKWITYMYRDQESLSTIWLIL